MGEVLFILMRWLHILSMTTLIGGLVFARLIMAPSITALAEETRAALAERTAALFRPFAFAAMAGLLISGTFNLLTTPGHSRFYHMLLGLKLLLAMHVFAVGILIVKPNNARRVRMMTGTMISGLAILLISAWLRRIF